MKDLSASKLALFRFTLSHLPRGSENKTAPTTEHGRDFKTFGFFDQLRVSQETPHEPRDPDNVDRYKRTFFGWGDCQAVWRLLERAKESDGTAGTSGYLAICLVKLVPRFGHANYFNFSKFLESLSTDRVAYLACLDSPDVIVLSAFGDRYDPVQEQPLARLLEWSEKIRTDDGPLKGEIERVLTMVACHSPTHFFDTLAARDADPEGAAALVRITDMDDGRALPDLLARINPALASKLRTTVGYYDIQAETSVPDAAHILSHATALVRDKLLTTSTCFTSPPITPKRSPVPLKARPDGAFLKELKELRAPFDALCQTIGNEGWLNPQIEELVAETIARFDRLLTTGLIPGSRLLIWTAHDAINALIQECESYLRVRPALKLQKDLTDLFVRDNWLHQRQRDYAHFLRAICDELDHRIALSLAAHTRFFPCSIEVPLKMVGALDMASRLIAASFRSYRCRQSRGLLQVFIAKAVKPSEFFRLVAKRVAPDDEVPFPTLVLTMFSPQLVRHFYYALFLVLYEVAQCIIAELTEWPSFTSLVFSHAFAERIAVISALAEGDSSAPLPMSKRTWANEFLTREFLVQKEVQNSRVGPACFMASGVLPKGRPAGGWTRQEVWNTDAGRWKLTPLEATDPDAPTKARQYCRDARLLDIGVGKLTDSIFKRNWMLHVLPQMPPPPPRPDGTPQNPEEICANAIDSWSGMGNNFWNEYLELASLMPFLRLFEEDKAENLFRVLRGLIRDHWDVWRDTENPATIYDCARRYVVALASMDIFYEHLQGIGVDQDCRSDSANERIMKAIREKARALGEAFQETHAAAPRAYACYKAVWALLADPGAPSRDGRAAHAAEPLIVQNMVRFLVRLLHVYHSQGLHVIDDDHRNDLRMFNDHGREMFLVRDDPGKETIPVPSVLYLWALQYQLSEDNPKIGFRFKLDHVALNLPPSGSQR